MEKTRVNHVPNLSAPVPLEDERKMSRFLPTATMNCLTCIYGQSWTLNPMTLQKSGYCHRYPPIVNMFPTAAAQQITLQSVPVVTDTFVCGEFRRAEILSD